MSKFKLFIFLLIILTIGMIVNACSANLSSQSPSTPTSDTSSSTAGQLADMGKTVFANRCAGCHGDSGQGVTAPAIIGATASLDKYNTAQGLFKYISEVMPANAPGSLSQQSYLQVLAYLLVENNLASPGMILDSAALNNIQLK